jgi:hypothetical protein
MYEKITFPVENTNESHYKFDSLESMKEIEVPFQRYKKLFTLKEGHCYKDNAENQKDSNAAHTREYVAVLDQTGKIVADFIQEDNYPYKHYLAAKIAIADLLNEYDNCHKTLNLKPRTTFDEEKYYFQLNDDPKCRLSEDITLYIKQRHLYIEMWNCSNKRRLEADLAYIDLFHHQEEKYKKVVSENFPNEILPKGLELIIENAKQLKDDVSFQIEHFKLKDVNPFIKKYDYKDNFAEVMKTIEKIRNKQKKCTKAAFDYCKEVDHYSSPDYDKKIIENMMRSGKYSQSQIADTIMKYSPVNYEKSINVIKIMKQIEKEPSYKKQMDMVR